MEIPFQKQKTNKQKDKQTNRQTDKQTNKLTDKTHLSFQKLSRKLQSKSSRNIVLRNWWTFASKKRQTERQKDRKTNRHTSLYKSFCVSCKASQIEISARWNWWTFASKRVSSFSAQNCTSPESTWCILEDSVDQFL